jgi:hypothetical protein
MKTSGGDCRKLKLLKSMVDAETLCPIKGDGGIQLLTTRNDHDYGHR